jgi:hypothetical protein
VGSSPTVGIKFNFLACISIEEYKPVQFETGEHNPACQEIKFYDGYDSYQNHNRYSIKVITAGSPLVDPVALPGIGANYKNKN